MGLDDEKNGGRKEENKRRASLGEERKSGFNEGMKMSQGRGMHRSAHQAIWRSCRVLGNRRKEGTMSESHEKRLGRLKQQEKEVKQGGEPENASEKTYYFFGDTVIREGGSLGGEVESLG